MNISDKKNQELKIQANEIRKSIVQMLFKAGSGHTAGSLDMADIFTLFYFHILKHNPKNPEWKERDRLILSNGHICPALYATMAHAGYFSIKELQTLRKFGSRLQGHPDRAFLKFLETSSGPLGSGLSQAIGMAIADKIDNHLSSKIIYCLMSDGELDEGQTWESIMLAGKRKLGNLIVVIDRNNIQIGGSTKDIMPLEPLTDKWQAFNWNIFEVSGSNFREINQAIEKAKESINKPSVIIAHTVPGSGVSIFENDYYWHGAVPNEKQFKQAMIELNKKI